LKLESATGNGGTVTPKMLVTKMLPGSIMIGLESMIGASCTAEFLVKWNDRIGIIMYIFIYIEIYIYIYIFIYEP